MHNIFPAEKLGISYLGSCGQQKSILTPESRPEGPVVIGHTPRQQLDHKDDAEQGTLPP